MSDEDDQLIKNGFLFIYLRENKNSEVKKRNVLRCLEEGANLNAVDGNHHDNTPLHIAVLKDNKDIVQLLIDKGANPNIKNLEQKTPLHIAVLKDNKDIVQLLIDKGANPNIKNLEQKTPLDIAKELRTDTGKEIVEILSAVFINFADAEKIKVQNNATKITSKPSKKTKQYLYSKRAGTSGVCGQLYETKLLSLVLLRVLNDVDIEDFCLGTNIDRIGALDDMCLRLKVKGHDKPIMIYLQAKHREDRDKGRLTVENVRNDSGDFSLIKYFDSYLRIKENFKPNNSDDMFNGDFQNTETNLIIYTPAKDLFTRKMVGKNKLSDKVDDIISTAADGAVFQFDYEDSDLESLTKMTVKDRVKSLGSIFLYFIMSEKDKSEVMMSNEHIARYHYVFSREVINVSDIHEVQVKKETKSYRYGTFRNDFFTNPSEYLFCLREIFYKEISTTHCDKTPIEDSIITSFFQEVLRDPVPYNISKIIGKLVTYSEDALRLEFIETTTIKKHFNKNVAVYNKIKEGLANQEIQPYVVREAVWIKLKSMTFLLPANFGNVDMSFRGTEDKVKNRIKDVVEKLMPLFINFKENKIVQINDQTVGNGKLIQRGLIEINGGIGSAVGNLLVIDNDTKMFKFDTTKILPKRAQAFLSQFLLRINVDELRKYRLQINIDCFPKYQFDGDQYDKRQANDFLNKLWFYTNQAQEDQVETILKKDINKFYNQSGKNQYAFRIHSDAIYLQSHDEVQKWWMKPGKAHYLNNTSQYFNKAKDAVIDSPVLTILNIMFTNKLQKLQANFNELAIQRLQLHQFTGLLNVVTESTILTASKINQYFQSSNLFTFIEFDYVLSLPLIDYNTLIRELKETKIQNLIVVYETLKYYEGFCNKIKEVINAFNGPNVIVVSDEVLAEEMRQFIGDKYVSIFDSNNYLIDLSLGSQNCLLSNSHIVFQGDETPFKSILSETAKSVVRTEILCKLLNNERLYIGKSLIDNFYRDTKDIYNKRYLSRDDEKIQVNTIQDVEDDIVVIASQSGGGKSALLTHVALNTKRLGPLPWIVRINLLDHEKDFEKWRNDLSTLNYVEIIKFLIKTAIKHEVELNDVSFEDANNDIIIKNAQAIRNPMVLFEIEYFLQMFNEDKVVFLFDDFNLISGYYQNEAIDFLKILHVKGKRLWITTCSYNHTIKALEYEFGPPYKLEPFDTKSKRSFLNRYFKTNLKLEKLNYEQFDNIFHFLTQVAKITNLREPEREFIPILSVIFHLVYVVAAQFFKSEVYRISPTIVNDRIKEKFDIDFNQYSPIDELLGRAPDDELELADTPLHVYIMANYFKCCIEDTISFVLDEREIQDKFMLILDACSFYRQYAEDQIKRICYKEEDFSDDKSIIHTYASSRLQFYEKHKKLGLYTLCRENDLTKLLKPDEIAEIKDFISKMQSGAEKSCLIDCIVNEVPRFGHLVLAEYFAVECLTDMLKQLAENVDANPLKNASLWRSLMNILLFSASSGIRRSFNYKLQNDPKVAQITGTDMCQKIVFELLLKQKPDRVPDPNSSTPITDAIEDKLFSILNLFLSSVQSNVTKGNVDQFLTLVDRSQLMFKEFGAEYKELLNTFVDSIQNMDINKFADILTKGSLTEVPLRHASNYCNSATAKEMTKQVVAVAAEVPAITNNVHSLVQQTQAVAVNAVNIVGNTLNTFLTEFMNNLQEPIPEANHGTSTSETTTERMQNPYLQGFMNILQESLPKPDNGPSTSGTSHHKKNMSKRNVIKYYDSDAESSSE